tara:strand:- start:263 stop:376 length:114 start_codon:yes stop_codon:yes gene_type:complete
VPELFIDVVKIIAYKNIKFMLKKNIIKINSINKCYIF